MLDVIPSGPDKRYCFSFTSFTGANLAGVAWIGKLYILAPYTMASGYGFDLDAISTTDCPISPRYHNCEHQKYSGIISVERRSVDCFDDVERHEVYDNKSYKTQPLFAESFESAIDVQGYVQQAGRYVRKTGVDAGYMYDHYENTQCHLYPVYGEDPTYPDKLFLTYSWSIWREYVPDPGCISHDPEDRGHGTKTVDILNQTRIFKSTDRYFSLNFLSYERARECAMKVARQFKRDKELLEPQLEASMPYGRLTYTAAENIRLLDINMISFIKEQSELLKGGFLKSLFQIDDSREFDALLHSKRVKKLKKVKGTINFAASKYLSLHYGTKLTAMDYSDLLEAHLKMQEMLYATQTMGSVDRHDYVLDSGTTVHVVRRCKAEIQSLTDQDLSIVEASDKFVRELFEIDILPSASNIWDLIPYSFVVDWFIPLGNKLEDIEKGHYIETLHPNKCFYSTKATYHQPQLYPLTIDSEEFIVTGEAVVETYSRECDKRFKDSTPCVEDASGMTVTHGIEAGALLISRFVH